MAAVVDTSPKSHSIFPQKLRSKLFRSKAAHDVAEGLEGGKPVNGAVPAPGVEETDNIQHPGGIGITVNDPKDIVANRDNETEEEAALRPAVSRIDEKRRASGPDAIEALPNSASEPNGIPSQGERRRSDAEEEISSKNADEEDERGNRADEVDRIEFYRRDQPYFWLSNSSDHSVVLDGTRYPTAEHLFQALKFLPHRADLANKIRKTSSSIDAIHEARKNISHVKQGWIGQAHNVAAMRTVLLLKFSQHSALRRQLLQTGEATLIENSPTDAFWGIAAGSAGGAGAGRNELGKALAHTRESLRNQVGLGFGSAAKTV